MPSKQSFSAPFSQTYLGVSLPCYFCVAGHTDQILFVPTAFCGSFLRALVKLEQHTFPLPLSAPSSPLFYHCLFLNQILPIFSRFHIFNAYKPLLYSAKFQECYSESSREIIESEDKIYVFTDAGSCLGFISLTCEGRRGRRGLACLWPVVCPRHVDHSVTRHQKKIFQSWLHF